MVTRSPGPATRKLLAAWLSRKKSIPCLDERGLFFLAHERWFRTCRIKGDRSNEGPNFIDDGKAYIQMRRPCWLCIETYRGKRNLPLPERRLYLSVVVNGLCYPYATSRSATYLGWHRYSM